MNFNGGISDKITMEGSNMCFPLRAEMRPCLESETKTKLGDLKAVKKKHAWYFSHSAEYFVPVKCKLTVTESGPTLNSESDRSLSDP